MFECSVYELENIIESEFGEEAELFYDIHCADPFDNKRCFEFPFVVLHDTGVYLSVFLDEFITSETKSDLEYICRVFKSYFSTKLPIHSVFLFRKNKGEENDKNLTVYDFDKRTFFALEKTDLDNVLNFFASCFENEIYITNEDEQENLHFKLSKESSDSLEGCQSDKNTFVKRKGVWVPAFQQDSEKAFYLALFGGFLGLHRFYLGLFGSGTLYFFTFGCLGLGWFFDCLEILLGHWKRKEKYLPPLENKAKCAVAFVVVFTLFVALVCSVLSFFLKNIQNL